MCTTDFVQSRTNNEKMFEEYAELYNIVNSYDNPDHIDLSGEFFQSAYSNPTLDLNQDVVLVRSSSGDLIGTGIAQHQSISSNDTRVLIQVHPEHRRQGIGTNILKHFLKNQMNQSNKQIHCRIFSFRPYSIVFALNHGFKHTHTWIKMSIQNHSRTQPTHMSWNLKVRALNVKTELDLWVDLQNRIFAYSPMYENITIESLKNMLKSTAFDPNLILVAEVGDNPIGICMGWSLKSKDRSENKKILQIQGMGIIPGYRREGYASTLLLELMNRGYIKGHSVSELLVLSTSKAGIRLYEKIGFTEKYRHLWHSR